MPDFGTAKARGFHSVNFGSGNTWINTWDDWHLVPSSRPVISPPDVNTSYMEIPGGDGMADFTEMLTGYPTYKPRTGSIEFIVINSRQIDPVADYQSWYRRYSTIMAYLHGRAMRMVFDDEPAYYYEGRFSVSGWKSGKGNSTITINYVVNPYKKKFSDSSKKF